MRRAGDTGQSQTLRPAEVAAALRALPGAPTSAKRVLGLLTGLLVVGIFLFSAWETSFTPWKILSGLPEIGDLALRMLPTERLADVKPDQLCWPRPPANKEIDRDQRVYAFCWHRVVAQARFVPEVWHPLAETLRIAVLSATFGALLAIPFSLFAARNLVRFQLMYWLVRSFLSLIRTIPDLVLAAVFVGAFGVGALPGILAMSIFSFTIIAKLLSESVEAIDPGPLEALQAVGANRLQSISFAVVPQVLPHFVAYSLYVFEINVRASAILGLVGAGGIGHVLKVYWNYFEYQEVAVIILVILAVVVVTDYVSNKIRERLV